MSYLAADFVEGVPGLHRRVEKVAIFDFPSNRSLGAWRIPWTEIIVHGVTKSWTQLSD